MPKPGSRHQSFRRGRGCLLLSEQEAKACAQRPNIGLLTSEAALWAIVADGFDRTTFFGFFTAGFLLRVLRLFVNERITAVIVALEIVRRRLAAKIAVDALIIDV